MKKAARRLGAEGERLVLGERTFAAISAVEGLSLSKASRKRLVSMKKRKLTSAEQRSEVIRAYNETKKRQ